jgi:glutamyl-tRNA reductase
MNILVVGLNHHTASLEIREKLHVPDEAYGEVLSDLRAKGAEEAVVLSTCNRTEVYVSAANGMELGDSIIRSLSTRFAVDEAGLRSHAYMLSDKEAYEHLFLVASGLDSMVVGEPQILGQVKDAYRTAARYGASGPVFRKVFHKAFQVAKRVRTETRIGYNPLSISSMAVELARKIFDDLGNRPILVIGAGEMCETALKYFKKEGVKRIMVTNRTFRKARQLADDIIGTAYPFEELPDLLLQADMVLSSTGAEVPVLDKVMVQQAMKKRKNRPLFFIDIAVPRDVEPAVNDIENVYLYDIDDLKELAQIHLTNRLQESRKARTIVDEEVQKFGSWLKQLDSNPLITEILESVEQMRTAELEKTLRKLKDADHETVRQVEVLTRAIVNKLIHRHLVLIKRNGSPAVLDLMKSLFLQGEEDEKEMDSGDKGE